MDRCERLTALCGTLLSIFACTILSSRHWKIETNTDYFRSSSKYNQLHLSRILTIFNLIYIYIGILVSSIYSIAFRLLLLATEIMFALARKIIYSFY